MSSWFSRSRKPSGDGGNANERDDTTDRNGFENGRYTTVPDDDDGEARVDNNNINNNKSNIRSANRHVLNDFTIPDEEYDPDFEADLARAISESCRIATRNKHRTDRLHSRDTKISTTTTTTTTSTTRKTIVLRELGWTKTDSKTHWKKTIRMINSYRIRGENE